MFKANTNKIYDMLVPYIKRECFRTIDDYIKEQTNNFEKDLRKVLEPQLEAISVQIIDTIKEYAKRSEVVITLHDVRKEK